MKYAVVIEKGVESFGAYVPDLPGCVAVGGSAEEVTALIKDAIAAHVEGLRRDGDPIPEPTSRIEYIEVYSSGGVNTEASPS